MNKFNFLNHSNYLDRKDIYNKIYLDINHKDAKDLIYIENIALKYGDLKLYIDNLYNIKSKTFIYEQNKIILDCIQVSKGEYHNLIRLYILNFEKVIDLIESHIKDISLFKRFKIKFLLKNSIRRVELLKIAPLLLNYNDLKDINDYFYKLIDIVYNNSYLTFNITPDEYQPLSYEDNDINKNQREIVNISNMNKSDFITFFKTASLMELTDSIKEDYKLNENLYSYLLYNTDDIYIIKKLNKNKYLPLSLVEKYLEYRFGDIYYKLELLNNSNIKYQYLNENMDKITDGNRFLKNAIIEKMEYILSRDARKPVNTQVINYD